MQFSDEEKKFLTYCGDLKTFGETDFQKLLKNVDYRFNNVLELEDKDETEEVKKREDLQIALCLFLTVSAKESLDYASFCSFFYELNWNVDRITALWNLYDNKKSKIRWNLASCASHPPHIVDVKWKLDYIVKNFGSVRSGSLFYVITLYTQRSPGGKLVSLTFSCSLAQLTHLLTHLRQATRCIKNYASKALT